MVETLLWNSDCRNCDQDHSISFGSPVVFASSAVHIHIAATYDSTNNKVVIALS